MTRKEAINDLKILKDFFIEQSNATPLCLDYAIVSLKHQHGEWLERNVVQDRRDAKIPEWQSAKCSVCGKYHTTPYMYYFTNYKYCPNCGCAMTKENDDERN